MLDYVYHALQIFRPIFTRRAAWLAFCAIVLGFIGAARIEGVSSFCRFWHLQAPGYLALLHLFRSSAWTMADLLQCWGAFVLSQHQTFTVDGRVVFLGDHTMTAKDGRRMPGVVTLHQDSETQSKPQYFRGHCWGAIGLLIGTLDQSFCLPLVVRIHQGFTHLRQEKFSNKHPETLATRLVQMAIDFAIEHNLPSILVLDAFFSVAPVFKLTASIWSVAVKEPIVTILVRAKKSYVAFFPAEPPQDRGPGRPRKYGEKVKLCEIFDRMHLFDRTPCCVYGEVEQISFLALNLLWKPTGDLIRFVFAVTRRGPIVLMCSDLGMNPITAIELYCSRVREETMFAMLKHLIGAFRYHFWSKQMPRHSRKPKKNQQLKQPSHEGVLKVQICWQSYERFVMLAAIALGLLQLIARKFSNSVWARFTSFLRTRSRSIPSEKTVKEVVGQMLLEDFVNVAPSGTMQEIRDHFLKVKRTAQERRSPVEEEAA